MGRDGQGYSEEEKTLGMREGMRRVIWIKRRSKHQ